MKNTLLITVIIFMLGCSSFKNIPLSHIKKTQTQSETFEILNELASDKFEGREPGTNGYELTMSYVESFLLKNKIKPFFANGYRDSLEVYGKVSANLVALIGDRDKTKKHILIGAHLDHLGKSGNTPDSVYNGANDNASGVTAVLQLAKALNKFSYKQNIIIALFTAEESGLKGSRHLAQKLKNDSLNLSYMLNFEMIGKTLTSGPNQVYITGFDKSDCASKMNQTVDSEFVKFLPAEIKYRLFSRSDNYAFYKEFNIPSHTISTFDFENYQHYHQASDEIELLDIKNMNDVINTSTYIVNQFLVNDVDLTNTKPNNTYE